MNILSRLLLAIAFTLAAVVGGTFLVAAMVFQGIIRYFKLLGDILFSDEPSFTWDTLKMMGAPLDEERAG